MKKLLISTIIVLLGVGVLIFVVPLVTLTDRSDNVTQDNNVINKDEVLESPKPEVEEETEKNDVTHEMMAPSDVSTNDGNIKFYV